MFEPLTANGTVRPYSGLLANLLVRGRELPAV
jgi:hypothetical protein